MKKRGRPKKLVRDRLVCVFSHVSKDEKKHIKSTSNQSKWIRKAIQNQIKRDKKNG